MSTLMKLEKMPAGTQARQAILARFAEQLEAGNTITVLVETPTMTPKEVAEELGISRTSVLRKINSGDLPFSKKGSRTLIKVADFERFRAAYLGELGTAFAGDF
ncbi:MULTISPECIES: helix-turn-helix domain-containing protein [Microbacterium]|uniref:helix-turn-helix domain-containing protein n=1 Tax=Microbacterium TaxID=33882 RepID=UPI002AC7A730|nr:helix-turn-helix domain-containing protein [Microbacterium testaceum]MDZ5145312.1 helix-turn-helix domain-containing protein [Microbacterium testaceum]